MNVSAKPMTVPRDSALALAEAVADFDSARIPAAVLDKLRLNLADTLGVTVGARGLDHVDRVVGVGRMSSGDGPSSVLGHGLKLAAGEAAFVNGFAAHGYDFDDASKFVHPGCVVVPAVIALAEARNADARDVLDALVAGYEVAVRVGAAAGPAHRKRGFHPTGTCSVFGAAAGCARLLGLDPAQIAGALGFAGSMSAGITRYRMDGAANKHMHAGNAARSGLTAALLAESGLNGASDIFEGLQGFLEIYADGGRPNELTAGLGDEFRLTDADIKPYPSCRQTHGAVDLALAVAADLPEDARVEKVDVAVYSYAAQDWYAQNDVPDNWLEALLRIPYCVSACLRFGRIDMDVFDDAARADPELRRLVSVTDVTAEPAFDANWPVERPVRLSVTLADGRQVEKSLRFPSGSAETPLDRNFIRSKFSALYRRGLPDRDADLAFDSVLSLGQGGTLRAMLDRFA